MVRVCAKKKIGIAVIIGECEIVSHVLLLTDSGPYKNGEFSIGKRDSLQERELINVCYEE